MGNRSVKEGVVEHGRDARKAYEERDVLAKRLPGRVARAAEIRVATMWHRTIPLTPDEALTLAQLVP
jgi:hypothetical protein